MSGRARAITVGRVGVRDSTSFYVLKSFKRIQRDLLPRLADLGLHPGQEQLLAQLWITDGVTQRELVERLGVEQATVAKTVKRLEATGFVTRRPDPHDRRLSRVHLTGRGREVRAGVEAAWRAADRALVEQLTPSEADTLRELLRRSATGTGSGD